MILVAGIDDAVRHDEFVRAFQFAPQRRAERGRAGLSGLQRAADRIGKARVHARRVARELRDRAGTVFRLVRVDERERGLAGRMIGRQRARDDHRLGREQRPVDVLAAELDEFRRRDPVRLVDRALVAALDQRALRQDGRRAGARDQDRVGFRRDQLQCLARDARVGAVVALGRDDADLAQVREARELVQPAVAVAVREADETDRLHAVVGHVARHHVGHRAVALRHLERPGPRAFLRLDDRAGADQRDHRRLPGRDRVERRERGRRDVRPDHDVDVILVDQLADVAHRGARVGCVVEHRHLHGLPGDRLRPHQDGVLARDADRGGRAGRRQVDADLQVGMGGGTGERERAGGGAAQQGGKRHAGFSVGQRKGARFRFAPLCLYRPVKARTIRIRP